MTHRIVKLVLMSSILSLPLAPTAGLAANWVGSNPPAEILAARQLDTLSVASKSASVKAQASRSSTVDKVETYKSQMDTALALPDPAHRNAAITQARETLASNTNRELTGRAIVRLDKTLAIDGASSALGAARI